MSQPIYVPEPALASEITDEWVERVRATMKSEGAAARGLADRATIQIKSLQTNKWYDLMLDNRWYFFVNCAERDAVLKRLTE